MSNNQVTGDWDFRDSLLIDDLKDELRVHSRPSAYNTEIAIRVCQAVATNPFSLKRITDENPTLPNDRTIEYWRYTHPAFARNYNAAKKAQAQLLIDEIIDIIDDPANCVPEILSWAKERVKTRQWMASKLLPRIYGDKKIEDVVNPQDTLSKIQELVTDLNKKNKSEV